MVFKRGVSGNPGGRPSEKPWVPLTTTLKKMIEGMAKEKDADGNLIFKGMTYRQLMCISIIRNFIKGNPAAIKEVYQRTEGKVPQPIVGATVNDPVKINIVLDTGEDE